MIEETKKIVHLTKVIQRLNVLTQNHENEIRLVQSGHEKELVVIRDAYEKRLHDQQIDIERLKSTIANLIEWKNKVTESIAKDEVETKKRNDRLQNKLATAEALFQQTLDEQKRQYSEEKEKFQRDLKVQQKKLDDVLSDLNRVRQIHVDEKESIQKEYDVTMEREQTAHSTEIEMLEQRLQDLCCQHDAKISIEKRQCSELQKCLLQEQNKSKELQLHVQKLMEELKRSKTESQRKDQTIRDLTKEISDSLETTNDMKRTVSILRKDIDQLQGQHDDVQLQNKILKRKIESLEESLRQRADESDREAIKCAMLLSILFVQSNNIKGSLTSVQRLLKKRVSEFEMVKTSTKQDILNIASEFKAMLFKVVRSIQIQYQQRQERLDKLCEERMMVQEQSISLLQKQQTKLQHSNTIQQKVNAEIKHTVEQELNTLRNTIHTLKLLVQDEIDALKSASLDVKEKINGQTSLVIKSFKEKNQKALDIICKDSSKQISQLKESFEKEIQDLERRRREDGSLIEDMEVEYGKRYRDWDRQMQEVKTSYDDEIKKLQSKVNSLDVSNRQSLRNAHRIQESLTTRLDCVQNQYKESLAIIDEFKIERERLRTTFSLQQNLLSQSISYLAMVRSELGGMKQETISKLEELKSFLICQVKNILNNFEVERQRQQKKFQLKYNEIALRRERSQEQLEEASKKESDLIQRLDYLSKEIEKMSKMKSETMSFLTELRKSEADSRQRLVEFHEDRYAQLEEKLNEALLELQSVNARSIDLEKRLKMHRAKEDIEMIEKLSKELTVSRENEKKAIHEKNIFQR